MLNRFIIFGAGAVGSMLGGTLAKNGFDVILVGRKEHVDKIKNSGLKLIKESEEWSQKIEAVTNISEVVLKNGDLICLTIKSARNGEFIKLAQTSQLDKNIPVCVFQNGVRNETVVGEYFVNVYGGIVKMTSAMLKPGEILYKREGRIIIGKYPEGIDDTVINIVDVLDRCGFKASVSATLEAERWLKLLINLVNLPVSLVKRNEHEKGEFLDVQRNLISEGMSVLDKSGISYKPFSSIDLTAEDIITKLSNGEPFYRTSNILIYVSTWQDLYYKRKPLECEDFYQEIVKLGKITGINTPSNNKFLHLSKIAADKNYEPEKYSLSEFLKLLDNL